MPPTLRKPKGPIELDFIIRVCEAVFDELGVGHNEKVYQRAIGTVLDSLEIFNRLEVIAPTYMLDNVVGSGRIDIVVGRWVLELKAISTQPTKASGQLLKYLKSTNKLKVDDFNRRSVRSGFFPRREEASDDESIPDSEYHSAQSLALQDLYSGAVINFNQRTGAVQVGCVITPDKSCLVAGTPSRAGRSRSPQPLRPDPDTEQVAKFVRCCVETSDDPGSFVTLSAMARAFEDFSGGRVPPMRSFKAQLLHQGVRIEKSSCIRGRRGLSDYSGEPREVCMGVRTVS